MLPFGFCKIEIIRRLFACKGFKKQDIPYLILNGDRDYQVTVAEAEQWKNGNKNKNSKTIIYKD